MAEIEYTIEINPITNYTIELNEQGPQGARGYDGVGISSIDETSSQGLVDTYTITLDDGRTSNFDVTNGFSPTATVTKSGTVATITITDENGTTTAEVYDGNGSVDDVRLNEVSVVSDGVAEIYVDNTYDSSSTAPISGMGVADAGFITGIDSSDVNTALGYTPANEDLSNLSEAGQEIIDSKADVDLSNLSSVGQNIIDGKADTDLSNLSSVGQNIIDGKADVDLSNLTTTASPNFDGQWVKKNNTIASDVAAPTSTDLDYSLSSYLPNDNYNYEVIFRGTGVTGSTSGNRNYFSITSDIIPYYSLIASTITRSAGALQAGSTVILPVGTARTITILHSSNNTGTVSLFALGYRRIGTNS